jgi:hypothetical protein
MQRANTLFISVPGLCSTAWGADPSFTLSSPDLPPGKPIAEQFTANAFGCHGPNHSPAIAGTIDKGVVSPKHADGAMPPRGGAPLSDADVKAVAAFVWGISHAGARRVRSGNSP